jgi:hypothetical protein
MGNPNTIAHFGEQDAVRAFERDLRAAIEGVAQVEEPGVPGGAPGARGGLQGLHSKLSLTAFHSTRMFSL